MSANSHDASPAVRTDMRHHLPAGRGVGVPRFDEVVECLPRSLPLIVELKTPAVTEAIREAIRRYDLARRIIVAGFDPQAIKPLRSAGFALGAATPDVLVLLPAALLRRRTTPRHVQSLCIPQRWHGLPVPIRHWHARCAAAARRSMSGPSTMRPKRTRCGAPACRASSATTRPRCWRRARPPDTRASAALVRQPQPVAQRQQRRAVRSSWCSFWFNAFSASVSTSPFASRLTAPLHSVLSIAIRPPGRTRQLNCQRGQVNFLLRRHQRKATLLCRRTIRRKTSG
nr:hypothetical protein [Luteitalea sp.]